jgi:triacylglycerol esterase/lipase EstA (alpha/beta hydrolase family)
MRRAQLLEAVAYAAFALWLHGRGAGAAAALLAIPALFLGTRLAIVLAMFALAWIHRAARAPEQRIGAGAAIAMILREYGAFLALNFLRTPWEHRALRPDPPADAPGDVAIVLVHGYFANRACWAPFVRMLEDAGLGPIYVPSCPSHFASIGTFEEALHREIQRVASGRRVAIVAHSMGGLAARLHVARRGTARVARLVTIGSPHLGTRLAPWGVGENAREMIPGSRFLSDLERVESAAARPGTLSIYSMHDNMILPQDASRLEGARNLPVKGLGHISQFGSREIAAIVIDELRRAR